MTCIDKKKLKERFARIMKRRDMILAILFLIFLAIDIAMALCISLMLGPVTVRERKAYISMTGLNLMDVNRRCNCGISGLDHKFSSKRFMLPSNSTTKPKKQRTRMMNNIRSYNFKSNIGTDEFYDELNYLRSMGADDDEIVARLLSMNTTGLHTTTTTTTTSTTTKRSVTVDKELLKSIRKMINNKKLNIKPNTRNKIIKRSYPDEAPHCFVPLPKKILAESPDNHTLWKYHSYLISISGPKYLDDTEDLQYLCSGVIIRREYAVTGKHCIRGRFFKLLRVRSGSRYWCEEGLQHRILDVFFSASLALIKIRPPFKLGEEKLKDVRIGVGTAFAEVAATSAGWVRNDPRRFSKYDIANWGANCSGCRRIAADNGSCSDSFGHPLIDNAGILIGIRSCEDAFVTINEIEPLLIKFEAIVS